MQQFLKTPFFQYDFSGESVFWKRPQSFPKHKK